VITTIDRIAVPGLVPAAAPDRVRDLAPARSTKATQLDHANGSFATALSAAAKDRSVHLSGHALRRLEQRHIDLGPSQLDRLSIAFEQLACKGGRQSLVMLDSIAYVVHVPSKTVVTAVAPDDDHDSVFTQIDSVAIA
jgi:flagellar operon protein